MDLKDLVESDAISASNHEVLACSLCALAAIRPASRLASARFSTTFASSVRYFTAC